MPVHFQPYGRLHFMCQRKLNEAPVPEVFSKMSPVGN